jgi:prefoldin subunit 2
VLETLGPVPKDRKCFRLINGILMERTVADVVPALQTNAEGLKNVLEGLVKQYKDKQQEMEAWKVRLFYFRSSFALFRQSDMKSI